MQTLDHPGFGHEAALQVIEQAAGFLRRLDLTLRTPDALNIALVQRASAALATFNTKMAACASAIGALIAVC